MEWNVIVKGKAISLSQQMEPFKFIVMKLKRKALENYTYDLKIKEKIRNARIF